LLCGAAGRDCSRRLAVYLHENKRLHDTAVYSDIIISHREIGGQINFAHHFAGVF